MAFMDGIRLRVRVLIPASAVRQRDQLLLVGYIDGKDLAKNVAYKMFPSAPVPGWADRLRVEFTRVDDFTNTMDMQGMLTLRFRKGR